MQVVGLSILSGAHVALTRKVVAALEAFGADDVLTVVAGAPYACPRTRCRGQPESRASIGVFLTTVTPQV